jgi:hypothetical protein
VPNQRKAGLKLVGAWITDEELLFLKQLAAENQSTVTDLVREAVMRLEKDSKKTKPVTNKKSKT